MVSRRTSAANLLHDSHPDETIEPQEPGYQHDRNEVTGHGGMKLPPVVSVGG